MRLSILLSILLIFAGCSETGSNGGTSAPEFTLQCNLDSNYSPSSAPVVSSSPDGLATVTVIAVHGKNGSPLYSHMETLKAQLNAEGYDVVMPFMPWSGLNWDGSLCDGISYLNDLIATEKSKDKYVVLLGHSLAGPISVAYSALSDTTKADAVNVVAPGHFIHQSSILASAHSASIDLAKSMVASGQSEQLATFQTYNNGQSVSITTTPRVYLSMHDTSQFPDILASIPLVSSSTLWIAGQDDSLTTTAKNLGIINSVSAQRVYTYKELIGDHFTVLNGVPAELKDFF